MINLKKYFLNIMIVDDTNNNVVNLKNILNKFANKFHLKVMIANDGDKGVDMFKIHNAVKSIKNLHLIIMDLNMIRMDGDDATKQVKLF